MADLHQFVERQLHEICYAAAGYLQRWCGLHIGGELLQGKRQITMLFQIA
jgi:hypothetical protein